MGKVEIEVDGPTTDVGGGQITSYTKSTNSTKMGEERKKEQRRLAVVMLKTEVVEGVGGEVILRRRWWLGQPTELLFMFTSIMSFSTLYNKKETVPQFLIIVEA